MDAHKTGNYIAQLRSEKGLTQAELAQALFVSDKAVSRWETGRGLPDLENLEALSRELNTSVPELLQGERANNPELSAEVGKFADSALDLVRQLMKKRVVSNVVLGFLAGIVVVSLAVVHLLSPLSLTWHDGLLQLEELDDGEIIAVAAPEVAGMTRELDSRGLVFVSAHTTRLHQLSMQVTREQTDEFARTSEPTRQVILLGNADDNEAIYYYPGSPDDVLLWAVDGFDSTGGVQTLPRLVYNWWIVVGAVASCIGLVAYALLRKRWYARRVLKLALLPLSFTLVSIAALAGKFDSIYDASFYVSGIVLGALSLYALALIVLSRN